ncbi:uncharacterized protein Tco025E_07846 [Trypanosoma conorhini]|uniref:Uncharacterized protein n=1 Tax=Trypanosoma conorhini TaxID=83891 RepID=A0A422NIU6_9TRYP|nr:uncharacterized protein Tco025E_07846 [Trypanosoma conorhini]RNF05386.1 hypothetical protein Tco025E_07846 [Trypanosoma conorhini]
MPVRVLVALPPMDGPAVTEAVLEELTVSSSRLQQATRQRYPVACERPVLEGRWRGKWHRFAEEVAGLRCLLDTPLDYAEACGLWAHIAPNELRCCLVGEDPRVVRQADEDMGARLRERLLHKGTLHCFRDAALRAAQAEVGAGVSAGVNPAGAREGRVPLWLRRGRRATFTAPLWSRQRDVVFRFPHRGAKFLLYYHVLFVWLSHSWMGAVWPARASLGGAAPPAFFAFGFRFCVRAACRVCRPPTCGLRWTPLSLCLFC